MTLRIGHLRLFILVLPSLELIGEGRWQKKIITLGSKGHLEGHPCEVDGLTNGGVSLGWNTIPSY